LLVTFPNNHSFGMGFIYSCTKPTAQMSRKRYYLRDSSKGKASFAVVAV